MFLLLDILQNSLETMAEASLNSEGKASLLSFARTLVVCESYPKYKQ